MKSFIPDGYTLNDAVPPEPGLHGGLSYSYRPALFDALLEYKQPDGPAERFKVACEIVARQVVSWGGPEPVKPESVARLHPLIFGQVLDRVLGYAAPRAGAESQEQADAKN
jgi:hypothetical protein